LGINQLFVRWITGTGLLKRSPSGPPPKHLNYCHFGSPCAPLRIPPPGCCPHSFTTLSILRLFPTTTRFAPPLFLYHHSFHTVTPSLRNLVCIPSHAKYFGLQSQTTRSLLEGRETRKRISGGELPLGAFLRRSWWIILDHS